MSVADKQEARPPIDAKKSWKKCSAHVYISRLIKVLQITEGKDGSPLQPTQLTTHEGLKQGASEANKLQVVIKNGSTGAVSTIGVARSAADKSLNEVNNAILLHKRLLEDQQHASTTSGPYASQKKVSFLLLPFMLFILPVGSEQILISAEFQFLVFTVWSLRGGS